LDYMGRAIEIGSKTAEKKLYTNKQTDRQTDRHYENYGHLAVNQLTALSVSLKCSGTLFQTSGPVYIQGI